ncbi:MAG: ABC transporter permease [Defluviitaleaceae bacterium]|nr:ABC transporter permease [Defluviitaleaceae bacterium]MCL2273298.1 ABC transporter permease [Defluviitaleaceae bacterium]
MDTFINFFNAAVLAGAPLLFGTMGEILTEKSGNLNLGVEGMMFMGALSGLVSVFLLEMGLAIDLAPWLAVCVAIAFSFIAGALGALIYSVLVVTLRTQQNVTGLALTMFGIGVGNFLGEFFGRRSPVGFLTVSARAREGFRQLRIPLLSEIPIIGEMFFNYNVLVYLGILIAIVLAIFFKFTRVGLNLRAVGENPAAADAASIPVARYKYLATCIGGGICGIGGMYIIMVTTSGIWVHNAVQGFGWISVALVIFATWSPARAVFGSLLFGALTVTRFYLPLGIPMQIYDTLPYIATILVLIFTSIRPIKEHAAPAGLGLNYFREDR